MLVTAGVFTLGTVLEISLVCLTLYLCYCIAKSFLDSENGPKLLYKDSQLNDYLLSQCKHLKYPFRPTVWAQNAHLQSFLGFFTQKNDVLYEREYLQLLDKGIVALD